MKARGVDLSLQTTQQGHLGARGLHTHHPGTDWRSRQGSQGSKTFLVFTYCVIKFVQWSCPSAVSVLSGHGRPSRLSRTSCRWRLQPQCVSKVMGSTSVHRPGTTNKKSY